MQISSGLERCLSFINCQLQPEVARLASEPGRRFRAVTISRQAGSGGHALAEKLAEFLQAQETQPSGPWTVFDRNLVEQVLQDHHLPARLARFMAEDHVSEFADT